MLLLSPTEESALLAVLEGRQTEAELTTLNGVYQTLHQRRAERARYDKQAAEAADRSRSR
jgi:hypothetical protein